MPNATNGPDDYDLIAVSIRPQSAKLNVVQYSLIGILSDYNRDAYWRLDVCLFGSVRLVEKTATNFQDSVHKNYQNHEKLESDWIFQEPQRDGRSSQGFMYTSEPKTPVTPPERIYRELGNFASRQESLLHPSKAGMPSRTSKKTPDEEDVVEMIKKWRVGEEDTPGHNDDSGKKGQQSSLKKDNVAPVEVVEIIKDYRTTNKIKYVQYQESTNEGSLVEKLEEVKDIFNQTSNEMEWERINVEALTEIRKEHNIKDWEDAKNWALEANNFFRLGQKIISLAEKTKIFQEYTTLNDNFKQRLENKNRYQDEKKISEKRPILESPSKWSDIEDEEERNKAFTDFYKEKRQRELILSPSQPGMNQDEEVDEDTEEEEKEGSKTSSPKKKKGKKKKTKKNR
ncbi:hypothetical protein RhiirC2_707719 [Rhizophagus irregularis]|uniref:Uncharacterized protein n=1 Tax=Rhizophagus irregularis TaxID=588596 RepID=A0A2N1NQ66_9GLOM|nr:hypothetical protein RhiirC2_707719 [Rhizophagus irregularis]